MYRTINHKNLLLTTTHTHKTFSYYTLFTILSVFTHTRLVPGENVGVLAISPVFTITEIWYKRRCVPFPS